MAAGFISQLFSGLSASAARWVEWPDASKSPVHGVVSLDPNTGLALDVAAAASVKQLDSTNISNALAATGNLFSVDMDGYNSISFDLTGTWVATVTFEASEDNVNWRSVLGMQPTTASTQPSASTTSPGMWIFKRMARYFRARVSSFTSGSVVVSGGCRQTHYNDWVNGNFKLIPSNTQSGTPSGNSRVQSAASTNATNLRTVSTVLNHILLTNKGAAIAYMKFYNKASAPVVGTDVPLFILAIPANGIPLAIAFPTGIGFSTGLAYAITTGEADADTGAVAANQVSGILNWS